MGANDERHWNNRKRIEKHKSKHPNSVCRKRHGIKKSTHSK